MNTRDKRRPPGVNTEPHKLDMRRQAEEIIRQKEIQLQKKHKSPSSEEIQKALHELRVHQIELEMQNEELRRAHSELDLMWSRYFDLYDLAPVGYCTISEKGLILEANLTMTTLLGVTRGSLLNKPLSRFVVREDQDLLYLRRKQLLETDKPLTFELRMLQADGTPVWVSIESCRTAGSANPNEFRAVFTDITRRKKSESRLHLQGEALEAAANALVITDNKGIIEWANAAFTTVTGYAVAEVIGKPCSILKSGKQDNAFYHELWETILAGKVWHGEIIDQRKDGSHYTEDMTITPLKNEHGEVVHFIAVKQDITERKKIDKMLLHSQRMESIGTMASGIAHDINNILAPITLSADLLATTKDSDIQRSLTSTIKECTLRAAHTIKQLLIFTRDSEADRVPVQLNSLVNDLIQLLNNSFPKNITITAHIPAKLWLINADGKQIQQMLQNLFINARDAMPDGGTLNISAEFKVIDAESASIIPDTKAGNYVMLTVTDSGTGIPPEIIPKIFDPFFTTKEFGKGTGLGLFTSLSIVHNHGGSISVESSAEWGTTFKVFLPACSSIPVQAPDSANTEMPHGNGETVLVVDDEKTIATTTSLALKCKGYKTLTAITGHDALALFRLHADKIAVVLTDIMMPGIDGVELALSLKKIKPEIKIIACTGLQGESRKSELKAIGVQVILDKPYEAHKLLSVLHDVIHV